MRLNDSRRASATPPPYVALVVVAAQRPARREPATCATPSAIVGGELTPPLPARSVRMRFMPVLHLERTATSLLEDQAAGLYEDASDTARLHEHPARLRLLNLAADPRAGGHLDLPAGDKELPETANPITECDSMRSCAAPGPPSARHSGRTGTSLIEPEIGRFACNCAARHRAGRCKPPDRPGRTRLRSVGVSAPGSDLSR